MLTNKNIKRVIIKTIKNKYLTYFFAIFTLFFINESMSNNDTLNIFNLIMNNNLIKIILFIIILIVGYYNLGIALLLFINIFFVINLKKNIETFTNTFPNLIEKNEVLKYEKYINKSLNKNKSKEASEEKKKETESNEINKDIENDKDISENGDGKIDKQYIRMDSDLRKEKLLEELKEIEKNEKNEKNETIETDINDKYDNTKKNLELLTRETDDEEISSTESSSSNSSSSNSSSSNSDKEYKNVSMDKARKHVLNKIRNKIKKKYVKNK